MFLSLRCCCCCWVRAFPTAWFVFFCSVCLSSGCQEAIQIFLAWLPRASVVDVKFQGRVVVLVTQDQSELQLHNAVVFFVFFCPCCCLWQCWFEWRCAAGRPGFRMKGEKLVSTGMFVWFQAFLSPSNCNLMTTDINSRIFIWEKCVCCTLVSGPCEDLTWRRSSKTMPVAVVSLP